MVEPLGSSPAGGPAEELVGQEQRRVDWEDRVAQWRAELELIARLEGVEWVPLPEAEQQVGVSRSALRSWYRTGEIASLLVDGPHGPQRLVRLDEVAARADRSPRLRNRRQRELTVEAQVTLLQDRLRRVETELAALRRRLDDVPSR